MKKNLLSVTAILAIGFFTSNAVAQTSATTTDASTALAKIIKPMTLTQTSALNFGTINLLTGAGKVTLAPSAAISYFDGVVDGGVGDNPTTPAYAVAGTRNSTYALTLPANNSVIVEDKDGAFMKINDFTASFGASSTIVSAKADLVSLLSDIGADSFKVGGTLEVGATQAAGLYAGTFRVSVDYN